LTVSLHQPLDASLAADIAFRFMQRLSLATAERLERLLAVKAASPDGLPTALPVVAESAVATGGGMASPVGFGSGTADARDGFGWFRGLLGWSPAATVSPQHSLGEE
jgi:UDP-GlcNAc:undecaprenyl-phosphate GlcNAc-1-phosphate transferase